VKPSATAFHEELFGPAAVIYQVKDEQAAVDLANDSPFGLGGSVFTRDIERGVKVADQIDTGMVFINHPTWTAPDLPFGGVKRSGLRSGTLRTRDRRVREQKAHSRRRPERPVLIVRRGPAKRN